MDLNEVAVFVKVVQAGSFSHAARQMGMPNSTVSAKVSSLERRLGLTLIRRTTRRLNVTPAGEAFFARCLQGLSEIEGAEAELASIQAEPQGRLRLTAPVELGATLLPPLIAEFTNRYPKVSVDVLLTDRMVELLTEGVDLALRVGELKSSTLIARKVGSIYFAPFASPKYLKASGAPDHPKDLRQHRCLQFTPVGVESWRLKNARHAVTVPMEGRIVINDLGLVKAMALADNGVALLPSYFCSAEVQAGRLRRLLPDWHTNLTPVHFVYPAQKFVLPKLSSFVALAASHVSASLREYEP